MIIFIFNYLNGSLPVYLKRFLTFYIIEKYHFIIFIFQKNHKIKINNEYFMNYMVII